ncbi:MIC complex subunit mic19-like protein [Elsinoe fawcettii]|nr:MIC complex subunit mic19-like protein [Elsinoe fawcettii]
MGSGGSKQAGDPSQHVFSAETPVRFSQQVLEQLQNSPETDSTRARNIELQVQQRVQTELARIRDIEASRLVDLAASITPENEPEPSSSPSESDGDSESLGSRISSALTGGSADAEKTHNTVKAEIEKMKAKLDGRRKLEKPTGEVEKAKEDLVQCLRVNDRRPLDCWKEVEEFKTQVGKLERVFLEKSLR